MCDEAFCLIRSTIGLKWILVNGLRLNKSPIALAFAVRDSSILSYLRFFAFIKSVRTASEA